METVMIDHISETKKGRYALFCDGEFLFSVDEATFERHHIVTGMRLTQAELEAVRRDSDAQRAFRRALDILALRDHFSGELRKKLTRAFDAPTADAAVEKLREIGYINDEALAVRYAEELLERKGLSVREARGKLAQKGVERALIETALAPYAGGDAERAAALIRKKYTAKLAAGDIRAIDAALARRGFSGGDIREALRSLDAETDVDYDDNF